MTKPSYEELRITKHSGSPQIADSASSDKSSKTATETRPVRIQRKRTKGWTMPANTVYVGRPTKWGNPYVLDEDGTAAECVRQYRSHCWRNRGEWQFDATPNPPMLGELRGKNLACWCPLDQPCHADVLLELANSVAEN